MGQKHEYMIIIGAITVLANQCTAPPKMIIDQLTGWLWDEEEAGDILALIGDDNLRGNDE